MAEAGFELGFWRVLIRPGSPFSFGHLVAERSDPLPVFGLPGNPASSFVTFYVLVAPFLRRLSGSPAASPPYIRVTAGERMDSPEHLTHFFRVYLVRDSASGALECPADRTPGERAPIALGGKRPPWRCCRKA